MYLTNAAVFQKELLMSWETNRRRGGKERPGLSNESCQGKSRGAGYGR